jgi:hypothetical protein
VPAVVAFETVMLDYLKILVAVVVSDAEVVVEIGKIVYTERRGDWSTVAFVAVAMVAKTAVACVVAVVVGLVETGFVVAVMQAVVGNVANGFDNFVVYLIDAG